MTYLGMSERETPPKRTSLLLEFLLVMVSLFAVGCGGSGSDDFVVVGSNANSNNPPVPTGTVNFQFTRPQVDISATVPSPTTKLHIDFLNSQNASVFQTNVNFAPTVTVNGVPVTAIKAAVTALDANNIPLITIFFNLSVQADQTTDAVPAGPGLPVTFDKVMATPSSVAVAVNATQQLSISLGFSNGETVSGASAGGAVSFQSQDTNVATVSPTGLIKGASAGSTTVTVSYTLNGVTRTATVSIKVSTSSGGDNSDVTIARLSASPSDVTLTNSTTSRAVKATFFPANSTTGQTVSAIGTLGNFTNGVTVSNLTYASATGTLTSTAPVNGTAVLTLSFTPTGGSAVTTSVPITVARAPGPGGQGTTPGGTAARLVLDQENIFIASGGNSGALSGTFFAANSTVGVPVGGAAGNAFSATVASASPTGTQGAWTYNTSTNTVTASGGSPLVNAAANNSITYNITFTPASGQAASDTITATAVSGTDPRLTSVQSARINSLNGETLKLPGGSQYPLGILEVTGNGTTNQVAVANIVSPGPGTAGQYVVTSSAGAVTYASGTGTLALSGVGTANVTVTRNNTANNGPTTVGTIACTVVDATEFVVPATEFNSVLTLPAGTSGPAGTPIPYKLELVFKDSSRQDITPVVDAVLGTPGSGWSVNQAGNFFAGSVTVGTTAGNTLRHGTTPVAGFGTFTVPGQQVNTTSQGLTRSP